MIDLEYRKRMDDQKKLASDRLKKNAEWNKANKPKKEKKQMQIKEASGFILWFMQWCRFGGWTSLWDTIYIQPQFMYMVNCDNSLIKHEQTHIAQMKRYGKFMFMVRYCWLFLIHGYTNHPLEIEARKAARE